MRIALIGGVESATRALDALVRNGADVVGVLGYAPRTVANVSGYVDVVDHAKRIGISTAFPFTSVNDSHVVELLNSWEIEILMVVGLSQLVSSQVRATAKEIAVGFHPTMLPVGRGRAPIAWLVLHGGPGAATLFELTDGADEGDILVQVPFEVLPTDHASDVLSRSMDALEKAVVEFMKQVAEKRWMRNPQNEIQASYWGRRTPADGRIDWAASAEAVDALVRASSEPHPGAYTVTPRGVKVTFMRSEGVFAEYSGVPGRILALREASWLVACGTGAVLLSDMRFYPSVVRPRVGDSVSVRASDLDSLFIPQADQK